MVAEKEGKLPMVVQNVRLVREDLSNKSTGPLQFGMALGRLMGQREKGLTSMGLTF